MLLGLFRGAGRTGIHVPDPQSGSDEGQSAGRIGSGEIWKGSETGGGPIIGAGASDGSDAHRGGDDEGEMKNEVPSRALEIGGSGGAEGQGAETAECEILLDEISGRFTHKCVDSRELLGGERGASGVDLIVVDQGEGDESERDGG